MDLLWFCSVLCLLYLCPRLFNCALWSPAGKGLTSWISFVVSGCEFVTFPLVSWVGCGIWLYRFLIFAPLVTMIWNCLGKQWYYDLISKFQVGPESLLHQGLSEPEFYSDLVYKLVKIVGSNNFKSSLLKTNSHFKKIGYNMNVLQRTACLVVNPITDCNLAFLVNCTLVGPTSGSMTVLI